ncbi:hypothetical protein [Rhodoferax sp.]|uniref:hypothetical protein n=1 Tax=Rhodoferax sp. TaxID=50421 RepID=UPI002756E4B7|nr:hypothetical protein [Rhodoferax sp.]
MRQRFALTVLTAGLALTGSGLGVWLAGNHPLWPWTLLIGFAVWSLAVAYWPRLWLLLVPAALPLLNFSPWSGWLMFEEFDLLLLGAAAGGYARLAVLGCGPVALGREARGVTFAPSARPAASVWVWGALLLCLGVSAGLALWRGLADAGVWAFNWFDGHTAPLNSVRVFKSLGHALLLAPLIHGAMQREPERSMRLLAAGVLTGLAVVSLAVLWERHAFPGLFDFSSRYRTTALFWEMHVGGAAIDAFLAMSLPFLVWALVAARRPLVWLAVAVLAVLAVYAVLTTFSRGVYLAAAVPSAGLASLVASRWFRSVRLGGASHPASVGRVRSPGWKVVGSGLLAVALLTEVAAVSMAGTYMGERMGVADRDFAKRLAHWGDGLSVLATPAQWLFGIGLGRLPAHYAREVAGGEFSGAVTWLRESGPPRPAG